MFEKQVQTSQVVTINDVKGDRLAKGGNYRLIYHTKDNFKKLTKSLGLMDDFKVSESHKCGHIHWGQWKEGQGSDNKVKVVQLNLEQS